MELHCEKGVGKDHAKFSPVGALLCLRLSFCAPCAYHDPTFSLFI